VAADRDQFAAMLDAHGAAVLGLLRKLCGNMHDAEDLFQEVATRVWRHRDSWGRIRNLRPWLMTIAYRVFIDGGSKSPNQTMHVYEDDTHSPIVPSAAGRLLETQEARQAVEDALTALSPALRSVVALHYTGGLSLREVGQTLGISVGTVKSRLSAALDQLRRILQ
jgi:RNA polymerase sigma-70 factor (ECF subfamily)